MITFGGDVKVIQDFVAIRVFQPKELTAQAHSDHTHMGAAVEKALAMIEVRKQEYRNHGISYYKPRMIMITRGKFEGESSDIIRATGAKMREAETHRRIGFDALAVADADMELLREVSAREPRKLAGLDFREPFLWGHGFDSVGTECRYESGEQVILPSAEWSEV